MSYLYAFLGLLLLQFFLSKKLIQTLSFFLYRITRNHTITVYIFSILFLPGTLIHELSHYVMSHLLFVPTGNMTVIPKIDGENVRLGSVEIGKTDPLRRLFIGAAPFIFGTVLMILSLFFLFRSSHPAFILYLLTAYILFEISNTMFSSKKDMEGAFEIILSIIVISAVAYIIGIRIPLGFFSWIDWAPVVRVFEHGSYLLLLPITLDIAVILVFSLINKLINKN